MPLFDIRPGSEQDHPFVYATMLRSFADSRTVNALTDDKREYYRVHHGTIENELARSILTIATALGDPRTILGYILYEPGVLHYIYVKASFRGHGIAKELLHTAGPIQIYTHRSRACDKLPIPSSWVHCHYRA